jgi:hypothetical protein
LQTFLPYADFVRSARALDDKRLGKQRVEAVQIARNLAGDAIDNLTAHKKLGVKPVSAGWSNHPAVKMWRGHEVVLLEYLDAVMDAWVFRGFLNTKCAEHYNVLAETFGDLERVVPPWLGDDALHASHRSNLIRKLPSHYGLLWPSEPDDLPYVWPVR